MLAYAIFVTFVLGVLVGAVTAVLIAQQIEKRDVAKLLKDFDEAVEIAAPSTILKYPTGPNPFN